MNNQKQISNYEAILKMSGEELAVFLDYVYLTGLNIGINCKNTADRDCLYDECPYNEEWLNQEAEDAVKFVFSEDGDSYLPDAFVKAVLRTAGISEQEKDDIEKE